MLTEQFVDVVVLKFGFIKQESDDR